MKEEIDEEWMKRENGRKRRDRMSPRCGGGGRRRWWACACVCGPLTKRGVWNASHEKGLRHQRNRGNDYCKKCRQ